MNNRTNEPTHYKNKDKSYSVEKTDGISIGELLDGIRDKIKQALEKNENTSLTDSESRE